MPFGERIEKRGFDLTSVTAAEIPVKMWVCKLPQ